MPKNNTACDKISVVNILEAASHFLVIVLATLIVIGIGAIIHAGVVMISLYIAFAIILDGALVLVRLLSQPVETPRTRS
jgi:hypothetical protein